MLSGERFAAIVVGGGSVASRKAHRLLEGGVRVTVIAPDICDELTDLAACHPGLSLVKRTYQAPDVDGATIVIAATNDPAVNKAVAAAARERGLLVNVADDPDAGNFVTPSVHRSGDLTIAVSSGRTPAVAAAIRAELGRRFDGRYTKAISALRALRDSLLGTGRRDDWKRASRELISEDFCQDVEQGRVEGRVAEWR